MPRTSRNNRAPQSPEWPKRHPNVQSRMNEAQLAAYHKRKRRALRNLENEKRRAK